MLTPVDYAKKLSSIFTSNFAKNVSNVSVSVGVIAVNLKNVLIFIFIDNKLLVDIISDVTVLLKTNLK